MRVRSREQLLIWSVLGFGSLVYLAFLYRYGYRYLGSHFIDAPSFWAAADAAFNAHASPYAPDFPANAERAAGQYTHPFLYPPPSLLLFYPLSWFRYATAANVLLVVNHLAIAGIGALLLRAFLPEGWTLRLGAAIAAVGLWFYVTLFQPTRITLEHGQINLIVCLLLVVFWRLLATRRPDVWTSLSLALAAVLKTYPVLFVAMLLACGRYKAAGYTIAWIAALAGLSFVVLPEGVWAEWLSDVAPTGGYGRAIGGLFSPAYPHNFSVNAATTRLFFENPYTDAPLRNALAGTWVTYGVNLGIVITTMRHRQGMRCARAIVGSTSRSPSISAHRC